ncbi:MAG: hypothetical protein IPN86_07305 [Saprospiraceae bacterium]|nr:hypothetical protein [Saprospiraceae bacterium]
MNKYLFVFLVFISISVFGIDRYFNIALSKNKPLLETQSASTVADIELRNPNIKCVNGNLIFEFVIINNLKFNLDSIILEVNSPSSITIATNHIVFNPFLSPSSPSGIVSIPLIGNLNTGQNFCYIFKYETGGPNIIEGCVTAPPCGPCASFKQSLTCVDGFQLYDLSITNNLLDTIKKIVITPDNPNVNIGEGEPPFTQSNPMTQLVNIPHGATSNEEYIVSGSAANFPEFFTYTITLFGSKGDSCVLRCEHPNLTVESALKAIQFQQCTQSCDLTMFNVVQGKEGCCFDITLNNKLKDINIDKFTFVFPSSFIPGQSPNVIPIADNSWVITPVNNGIYEVTKKPNNNIPPGSTGPLFSVCNFQGNTNDLNVNISWNLITKDGNPPSILKECGTVLNIPVACSCFQDCCSKATASITQSGCIDSTLISAEPCTLEFDPVCGCDGNNYNNPCAAQRAGVTSWVKGACNSAQVFPNECCHDLSLEIPDGVTSVCLDITTPGLVFDKVLLRDLGFILDTSILGNMVCIRDTIPGRPSPITPGSYQGILKYCLSNLNNSSQNPQVIEVKFFKPGPTDGFEILCRDTIISSCPPPVNGTGCVSIKPLVKCVAANTYEMNFSVCNNSQFSASLLNLTSNNPDILFRSCTDVNGIPSSNFLIQPKLNGLNPGECVNDLCVTIISNTPINVDTDFCFNTVLFNRGASCTEARPKCVNLQPCDPCKDFSAFSQSIRRINTDTCCFSAHLDLNNTTYNFGKNILVKFDNPVSEVIFDNNWNVTPLGIIPGTLFELAYNGSIPSGISDLFSICIPKNTSNKVFISHPEFNCVDSLEFSCTTGSSCCVDKTKFDNLMAQGMNITVNGCEVTVNIPPFDTCHYIDYGGPIWGDGSIVTSLIIPALNAGPFTHTYTQAGIYTICMTVFESNDINDGGCWSAEICKQVVVASCPPNPSLCCVDKSKFDKLVSAGLDITVNGCSVTVNLPPFDTCHYIDNGGPIWGDGSFNTSLIIPALNAGPFVHTYTTPGVYNICLEVLESNDGGNTPCWTNQICKMVKVDNCCTGDACTLTDLTLSSSGGSNCCFTGTMTNNYCDNIYTGFHVQVTAPATLSQIQALSGYTIYTIDAHNAYLYPATAYVPKGSTQIFTMCPENFSNIVDIQISFIIPGFTGPVDQCTKTFQRTCSPPPPPNKCLTLVKDSIDCIKKKYCFQVKNSTSPGFNIVAVELYMVSPSNALTPKIINIPLLAPGATSDWICVDYKNVNPNDNVCFKIVGHREIITGTGPQYCCIDTIKHCFKVPDCCTGDACTLTDITLSSGGSNCCFTGTMTNNYCDNIYTGFHVQVTALHDITDSGIEWIYHLCYRCTQCLLVSCYCICTERKCTDIYDVSRKLQ